jgi:hypothetical protein
MADRLAQALEEAAGHDASAGSHAGATGHGSPGVEREPSGASGGPETSPKPSAVPDDVDAAVLRLAEESADA